MKRLLALLGMFPLVWTKDSDGDIRLRIARRSPFGGWMCHAVDKNNSVVLLPDGSTSGKCFVVSWTEWEHNKIHVVFEEH